MRCRSARNNGSIVLRVYRNLPSLWLLVMIRVLVLRMLLMDQMLLRRCCQSGMHV